MLTEHRFGLGVAWRMAGRPMGAFCPFLSGRDNRRAARALITAGNHPDHAVTAHPPGAQAGSEDPLDQEGSHAGPDDGAAASR
jgi:hypothetical protein